MRVFIAALWCVAPCVAFEFPVLYQFRHDCGPSGCAPPTTLQRTTKTSKVTLCGTGCFTTSTTTLPKTTVITSVTHTPPSTGTGTSTVTRTSQTGSTFSGTSITATTVTHSTSHTSTTTISKTTLSFTSSSTSSSSSTTTTRTSSGSSSATSVSSTSTTSQTSMTKTETVTQTTPTTTTTTPFVSTCTTTQPCLLLFRCDEDKDIKRGKLTKADETNANFKVYVVEKESPTVRHPIKPCKPNGDPWDPETCCPDCLPLDLCKATDLKKEDDRCKVSNIGTQWDCRRVTWNFLTTILQPAGQLMWVKKDGNANVAKDAKGNPLPGNCQPWCKFLVHDLACTREINHCNACEFCAHRTPGQGPESFQCQPDCTGADFDRENCLPGAQRYLECRGCAQCKTHKPCPCFRLVICECGLYLVTHRDENKYPLLYNPVNESNPLQGFKCPACLDRQGVCHNVTFGSDDFCGKKKTSQFFECPGHPPALLTSFEDDLWGEGCADNDVNLHFEEPWCGDVGRGFGSKTHASSVIQGVNDPHECQKKCAAVASCGNFTWTAGADGNSGKCSLYSSFSAKTSHHDYRFEVNAVSGPKTCGDHRKMVESMKYSGPKTVLKIPEPDEPTIVEAKFQTKMGGMHSDGKVFFLGYIAAGMGVAGLFVLAAYTLYRRAHREYNGAEILENGLSEASTLE